MAKETNKIRTKAHIQAAVDGGISFEDLRKAFEDACDRIEQQEQRIKAMYNGDLSPESRLNGYKVVTDSLIERRDELLKLVKEQVAKIEQLEKAIESFGNNPAGFDWGVLDKIDELEIKIEQLKERISFYKQTESERNKELEELYSAATKTLNSQIEINDKLQYDLSTEEKAHEATRGEWQKQQVWLKDLVKACEKLGPWMSAALEDKKVCAEMKNDINCWFAGIAKAEEMIEK